MKDPDKFCIMCGHRWGIMEETCPECGFDPVGNYDDEEANDKAREEFKAALPEGA